jgi:hypothetical protein
MKSWKMRRQKKESVAGRENTEVFVAINHNKLGIKKRRRKKQKERKAYGELY